MSDITTQGMIEWMNDMIDDNLHSYDDATLENEMPSAIHAFLVKHSDPDMVLVPRESTGKMIRRIIMSSDAASFLNVNDAKKLYAAVIQAAKGE